MSAVTVRVAQPGEAEVITALLRAAFAEFESRYTPEGFSATAPEAEHIRARFGEGPVWVAELDGATVGTVSGVPREGALYVRSMAVLASARAQGVGRALLSAAEAYGRVNQYRRLTLSTTPFLGAAIRLYEKAGFRFTGERSDLFGTTLLEMEKPLESPPRYGVRPA
jgi:ribosomal protein S18 acetylase RimI-like enzyme